MWKGGPISASVFTYGYEVKSVVKAILYYRKCYKQIEASVSYHLVYSDFQHPLENLSDTLNLEVNCSDPRVNKFGDFANFHKSTLKFSTNALRNIAIQNSNTPYILVIDVDFVPSKDSYNQLHKLLSSFPIDNITAIVLPSFELQNDQVKYLDKHKLVKLVSNGTARQFYAGVSTEFQKASDYPRWLKLPITGDLNISYAIKWNKRYEPFYVASRIHVPKYDERFKQFIFDRMGQVCETYLKGFNFMVVNNAFVVHRGFKMKNKLQPEKDKVLRYTKPLIEKFLKEKTKEYSHIGRTC